MRIVVVGSGVAGASTAYHLARAGAHVTIVDRGDPGGDGQATAAGAGIICPGLSRGQPDAWYSLAFPAAAYYPELVGRLADDGETDLGYGVPGAIFVGSPDEPLEDVRSLVAGRRETGAPAIGEVAWLEPGEPQKMFPYLRGGLAAVHIRDAARVDGRLLRDSLLRAAEKHGAIRRHGEAELARDGDRVTGATISAATGAEAVAADTVVVAAGAWTARACRPLDLASTVHPQRGQIVHLDLPDVPTERLPIVQSFSRHYIVGFPGGRVAAGATREAGSGYDHRVTAAGLAEVLVEAQRIAPGLGDATVRETRVGFRPASDDGLPLLGTAARGLVLATGMGATGLTLGPYAGALAAGLALGEPVELDLTPYDPRRTTT